MINCANLLSFRPSRLENRCANPVTAQAPDELHNTHPDVDFGSLKLYGVVTGDITANHGWGHPYPFTTPPTPPEDQRTFSALWRGYIATFQLSPDGKLTLVSYTYPNSPSLGRNNTEAINELLVGDFWLVMKPAFKAPRTYVPFHNGVIVSDTAKWVQPRQS